MSNDWTKQNLQNQLHISKKLVFKEKSLYDILHDSAAGHGLEFPLVLAVVSRETEFNLTWLYKQPGDNGHGFGPMQLDNRSHVIPKDWKTNPTSIVNECCVLLALLIGWAAHKYPKLTKMEQWKIALAAYNAGEGAAVRGHNSGDADKFDTGHDYGADTLKRYQAFSAMLKG